MQTQLAIGLNGSINDEKGSIISVDAKENPVQRPFPMKTLYYYHYE
ncbi:hypothetical protein [Gracilibacillus alcaliphilus]|nr:hypothetical protein [Gracilibacillus alcaliphilus]MBM7676217.1 hypothetical protein [Gracilibacillus alcaliphilus]